MWKPLLPLIAVAPIVIAFTTLVTILVAVGDRALAAAAPRGLWERCPAGERAPEGRASEAPTFPRLAVRPTA